jgi:VanZ family protein
METKLKNSIIRILILFACLIWIAVIFSFSNEPSVISSEKSNLIADVASRAFNVERTNTLHSYIRKTAHVLEYSVLGMILALFFNFNNKANNKYYNTLLIGILIAVADEKYQSFVPGRGPGIKDVFLDFLGVAVGAALFTFSAVIVKKIKYFVK